MTLLSEEKQQVKISYLLSNNVFLFLELQSIDLHRGFQAAKCTKFCQFDYSVSIVEFGSGSWESCGCVRIFVSLCLTSEQATRGGLVLISVSKAVLKCGLGFSFGSLSLPLSLLLCGEPTISSSVVPFSYLNKKHPLFSVLLVLHSENEMCLLFLSKGIEYRVYSTFIVFYP